LPQLIFNNQYASPHWVAGVARLENDDVKVTEIILLRILYYLIYFIFSLHKL